jgi:hypothetical protein
LAQNCLPQTQPVSPRSAKRQTSSKQKWNFYLINIRKNKMNKLSISLLSIILLGALTALACGFSGSPSEALPTVAIAATFNEVTAVPSPTTVIEAAEVPVEEQPEATATTAPANEGVVETPTAEPAPAQPETISLNPENNYGEPTGFDSYRMTLQFQSTLTGADGSVTNGAIMIEGLRDVALNATSFTATASGTADFGGGQQFNFTELADTTYFILPNGGCTSFAGATGTNPFAIFVDDGGVLGDLEGAQVGSPPTETINGILTNHYVFDETNLDPSDPTTPDITTVSGDIYLAADGGYVVRIIMQGTGASTLLNSVDGDGDIYYELNYLDFNTPVDITIPTGCAG